MPAYCVFDSCLRFYSVWQCDTCKIMKDRAIITKNRSMMSTNSNFSLKIPKFQFIYSYLARSKMIASKSNTLTTNTFTIAYFVFKSAFMRSNCVRNSFSDTSPTILYFVSSLPSLAKNNTAGGPIKSNFFKNCWLAWL